MWFLELHLKTPTDKRYHETIDWKKYQMPQIQMITYTLLSKIFTWA